MTPSTPYQTLTHFLSHDGDLLDIARRKMWLEDAGISYLYPDLLFDVEAKVFVARLLEAAAHHDQRHSRGDHSLRAIVTYWRDSREHTEMKAFAAQLLAADNLATVLFPNGIAPDPDPLSAAIARFERLPTTDLPPHALLPTPHTMALPRNHDFVGRDIELQEISKAIATGTGAVVAAGIGGVGKSQLAVEWVHRYGQYFQGGVFWLDFQDENTALLSIATAGEAYTGKAWEGYATLDLANRVARVRNEWKEPLPTLLVFDNCEDITLANKYLPVSGGAGASDQPQPDMENTGTVAGIAPDRH